MSGWIRENPGDIVVATHQVAGAINAATTPSSIPDGCNRRRQPPLIPSWLTSSTVVAKQIAPSEIGSNL